MGRTPKYQEVMENVTYRLRPRTRAAIAAEARRRNLSQAELVDRLVLEAGLYAGAAVEFTAEELAAIAEGPGLIEQVNAPLQAVDECQHPRSMHSVLNGGLVKCRCGKVRNMAQEWN